MFSVDKFSRAIKRLLNFENRAGSFGVSPPPPGLFLYPPQPGGSDPTPVLYRKRMVVERWARRHSKDLDEMLPKHFLKFKIEITCQVKVRSNVKIECIQVADRRDLKCSFCRPKFSICTPKDQAKVLTSDFFIFSSGQCQGQVKKGHQTQNFQMSLLTR